LLIELFANGSFVTFYMKSIYSWPWNCYIYYFVEWWG